MIDINLLPRENLLSVNEKIFRGHLITIIFSISLILFIVSLIIFGLKFFTDSQLTTQTKKRDLLLSQFESQFETANKFRILKNKVIGIKIIQDSRTGFDTITAKLRDMVQGTELKNFIIDSDGNVHFFANANNTENLDSFIQKISMENGNPFTETVLSGLNREVGGGFSYSVNTRYLFSKQK